MNYRKLGANIRDIRYNSFILMNPDMFEDSKNAFKEINNAKKYLEKLGVPEDLINVIGKPESDFCFEAMGIAYLGEFIPAEEVTPEDIEKIVSNISDKHESIWEDFADFDCESDWDIEFEELDYFALTDGLYKIGLSIEELDTDDREQYEYVNEELSFNYEDFCFVPQIFESVLPVVEDYDKYNDLLKNNTILSDAIKLELVSLGKSLDVLKDDKKYYIRRAVADNIDLAKEPLKTNILNQLEKDHDLHVRASVVRQYSNNLNKLTDLFKNEDNPYVKGVIIDQGIDIDKVIDDITKESTGVKEAVARRGLYLDKLYKDENKYVREQVASSGKCTMDMLLELSSTKEDVFVRASTIGPLIDMANKTGLQDLKRRVSKMITEDEYSAHWMQREAARTGEFDNYLSDKDRDWSVRKLVALCTKDKNIMEKLLKETSPTNGDDIGIRRNLASRGFALEELINDDSKKVTNAAKRWLYDHDMTMNEYKDMLDRGYDPMSNEDREEYFNNFEQDFEQYNDDFEIGED